MKNYNNRFNFKTGQSLLMIKLKEGITIAVPTIEDLSNIKVVSVNKNGSFTAHWEDNFNLKGDFRTELMSFDANLVLDEGDKEERNETRRENGLVEIG